MLPQLTPVRTSTLEAAIVDIAQSSGGAFRVADARVRLAALGHKVSSRRVLQVVEAMVKHGRTVRLDRGSYAVADGLGRISPLAVGSHLTPDGFVSLWTAADYYKVTSQDVSTVAVVTATRRRRFSSDDLGASFAFHMTTPDRLFGWHEEPIDGVFARLADIERMLIDLLWFEGTAGVPEPAQVLAIWRASASTVNPFVLVDYAKKMRSQRLSRRVGYLMDECDLEPSAALVGWRQGHREPTALFRDFPTFVDPSTKWGISG